MDDKDDDEPTPRPMRLADVKSSPIIRLLETETTPADYALADRLGKLGGDHRLLCARLVRALEAEKQTSGEELADQLGRALDEHDKRLDAIVLDVRDFKTGIRWGKALGYFALGIAVSVAGFVAVRMLSGEELKGEYRVRLDHLEIGVRDVRAAVDRLLEHLQQPKDKP